jgi:hypothetical protein
VFQVWMASCTVVTWTWLEDTSAEPLLGNTMRLGMHTIASFTYILIYILPILADFSGDQYPFTRLLHISGYLTFVSLYHCNTFLLFSIKSVKWNILFIKSGMLP